MKKKLYNYTYKRLWEMILLYVIEPRYKRYSLFYRARLGYKHWKRVFE